MKRTPSLPEPRLSATVEGAITNRVYVRGPRRGKPKREPDTVSVYISMQRVELEEIDAAADKLGLTRSRYLVLAATKGIRP